MKKPVLQRDSEQTRCRILAAVGELLATSGFRNIGVNAIARQAGVDKVLIYRYFGGLPELLKAFAEESDFWPANQELQGEMTGDAGAVTEADSTEAGRARRIQLAFGRALRKRPLTQEIMRWELLERNELTDALARHREIQGDDLIRSLEQPGGVDIRAIGSILSAGQTYLILRSKTADVYNGLNLNSEEGWARIERAIGFLVDAAFLSQQREPDGSNPRPAAMSARKPPRPRRGESRKTTR